MVTTRVPTTSTLLAFEAAARFGSFTRAAQELVITEGGISRQVARLEKFLGVPLFRRNGNRVELTEHGARYAEDVGRLLTLLEQSTRQVMTTPRQQRVCELATISTFADKWLIPRLPRFLATHPGLVVNVSVRNDPFVVAGSGFDAAISFAHPAWLGAESRVLFGSPMIPVCQPGAVPAGRSVENPVHAGLPLLHKTTTPESWSAYSREFGFDEKEAIVGSRFETFSMLIEAAIAGLGVALVPHLYVADDLRSGRLIALGPAARTVGKDFLLVTNPRKSRNPLVDEFSEWLVDEATPDAHEVEPTSPGSGSADARQ